MQQKNQWSKERFNIFFNLRKINEKVRSAIRLSRRYVHDLDEDLLWPMLEQEESNDKQTELEFESKRIDSFVLSIDEKKKKKKKSDELEEIFRLSQHFDLCPSPIRCKIFEILVLLLHVELNLQKHSYRQNNIHLCRSTPSRVTATNSTFRSENKAKFSRSILYDENEL